MNQEKYNYSLNGIEHEIILNNNLRIEQKPLNQIILVSNKYIMKYINDLFDFHNIEYCLVGEALLGCFIFHGVNIFNQKLEICTLDINFFKIKKLEDDIKNDGFDIYFHNDYIKISTIFFNKMKCSIYIYPISNDDTNDTLKYKTIDNKFIHHQFYDVFPIYKYDYEEFQVSVPNKMDKVLEAFDINLNFICFSTNKNNKNKIIEEIDTNKSFFNSFIKDNVNKVISIIKPFIFTE